MAKRGRKPKNQEPAMVPVQITRDDYEKLLRETEDEQKIQLETFYKSLAKVRHKVDLALTHIINMENCDSLSEATFKAGRAYDRLDEANDALEEILEDIYDNNDIDHWNDLEDNF